MAYSDAENKYEQPIWDDDLDGPDTAPPLELVPPPAEEIPLPDWAEAALASAERWLQPRITFATQSAIITNITTAVLRGVPRSVVLDTDFSSFVVHITNRLLTKRNDEMPKGTPTAGKMTLLKSLTPRQIARFMKHFNHAVLINPVDLTRPRKTDLIAVYVGDGPRAGTYDTDEDSIVEVARKHYNEDLSPYDAESVLKLLKGFADRKPITSHPDLIAFKNGIFHYGNTDLDLEIEGKHFHFAPKSLNPFAPEFIFVTKTEVRYLDVPELPEVRIFDNVATDGPNGWEVREWMDDLGDWEGGEGITELLWEVIGASLRPFVSWKKTAFFISEKGNNGKGTLCALMRNILGPAAHASISITDFAKDFALESLLRTHAVIVDENDVNAFTEKMAAFKAAVTGDHFQVNVKFKDMINFKWKGFMVQCLNDMPKVSDKTGSFYRRLLFIPFSKSFTGKENTYIKDDYLARPEVLEYVAWYAMNKVGATAPGDYYRLSEPVASQKYLAEYVEFNDPIQHFWAENRDLFRWDTLPIKGFLYPLYKEWLDKMIPGGKKVGYPKFLKELLMIIEYDSDWWAEMVTDGEGKERVKVERPSGVTGVRESLIETYRIPEFWDERRRHWSTYWCKNDGLAGIKRKVPGSAKPLPGDLPCEDDCTCRACKLRDYTPAPGTGVWVNAAEDAPDAA
ncbi:phage/plasmid primase, P4 family [Brachybacterium sp.]|uniref:DNA primase family protein n=1 Tax=Brachybacterium sp. TaxID=1891286 RepID=UPI002ED4DD64